METPRLTNDDFKKLMITEHGITLLGSVLNTLFCPKHEIGMNPTHLYCDEKIEVIKQLGMNLGFKLIDVFKGPYKVY